MEESALLMNIERYREANTKLEGPIMFRISMNNSHKTIKCLFLSLILLLCATSNVIADSGTLSKHSWYGTEPIDDNGGWDGRGIWSVDLSGAPSNAVITDVDVEYWINHTYVGDLKVWLTKEEPAGVWHDKLLWNREGGSQIDIDGRPDGYETGLDDWDDLSPNGTWYLIAADYAPSDEGEIDAWKIWIHWETPKADLIARNLSVSDSTPDAGDAITVYFNILNQGGSTAGPSYQGIMLSSNINITASDQELASEYTGSLDPDDDTNETNYGVDIPTGISGRWYIGILVDKNNDVEEGDNENNNNTAYVPIDIPAPPDPPDLELQTLDATNGTYHPGDNIDVQYVIRNIGDEVSDSYTVDFYASTNTTISDSDYKIDRVSWTGLAGNTTRDKTLSCQFPPNSYDSSSIPENDYYIGAIVTCSNDSDSSNNKDYDSTRVSIVFSKPDLTPYKPNEWDDKIPIGITRLAGSEDHSFSGPYYNDQILYFNWASLNQGGAPALNYTIRMEVTDSDGAIYVATCDTQPNSYSYGPNDFQVGPLSAGSHTFKLWVDDGNLIDNESDETNNYYERTISVQSRDIDSAEIVSFTPPPIGLKERGDQVTATVRVKNTGTTTRSFWVGLSFAEQWVDVNETPGPWPEGWYDVRPKQTASLPPQGWEDVQFDFIIPPTSAPGTYTARAAVWDGYDAYIHKMDEPRYAKSDVLSYTLDEYPNPAGPLVDQLMDVVAFVKFDELRFGDMATRYNASVGGQSEKVLLYFRITADGTLFGVPVKGGGSLLIDLADFYRITPEGNDEDWVTVWIDVEGGLKASATGLDVDMGITTHQFDYGEAALADNRRYISGDVSGQVGFLAFTGVGWVQGEGWQVPKLKIMTGFDFECEATGTWHQLTSKEIKKHKIFEALNITQGDSMKSLCSAIINHFINNVDNEYIREMTNDDGNVWLDNQGNRESNLKCEEQGEANYFYTEVPYGTTQLHIFTDDTGTGNADLYIEYGERPDLGSLYSSTTPITNEESIVISNPASGHWYMMVYAESPYEEVNLAAMVDTSPAQPKISVSPLDIDFGSVKIDSSRYEAFTVENTGYGTLEGSASVSDPFTIHYGESYSLSYGQTHTVTVRFSPTDEGTFNRNVTFTGGGGATRAVSGEGTIIVVAPVIGSISNDSVQEGSPYTGHIPNLTAGTQPITYSLITYPNGMTIDPETGVVSWTNPTASGSPHMITIRARNTAGYDDESWQLTVVPTGVCTYFISPTSEHFSSSGCTGSVSVTTESGCDWTATSNDVWITLTSGSSGSGNGTVSYSVSSNSSTGSRTGTMTIAGNTFTVTQEGINIPPTANAGSDQTVEEGGMVTLDGSNSTDPDDGIASYLWAQTGGTSVTLSDINVVQPTFIAPNVGPDGESLTFQLIVTDSGGLQSTDSCIVNITGDNDPPNADAGPDQTVDEGETVTLDGSNSTDTDDGIASYLWTQTAGTPVTLSDPTAVKPTFTSPNVGSDGESLTFQLAVTDNGGLQDTDTCIVNVTWGNNPPTADVGPDQTVAEGVIVTLDGSNSSDPDDGIASYLWAQTGGTSVTLSDINVVQPTFIAPNVGPDGESLTFQLIVTDSGGLQSTDSCIVNITGDNDPPNADAGPDQTVDEGETVTLDGSNSTDTDDGIASYLWTQTAGTPVTLSDPTAVKPTFVTPPVNVNGTTLTFELTVEDNGGLQHTDEVSVTINDNSIEGFPADAITTTCSTGEPIGLKCASGAHLTSLDTSVDPDSLPDEGKPENLIYGLINVQIRVDTASQTATFTIHLPTPAPDDYEWYKYNATNGWISFNREVISGGVGDGAEFTAGRTQVILYITDNGPYDVDPTPRIISDPGGLGSAPPTPSPPSDGGGGGGGCSIATAAYGSPMESHVSMLRAFRDTYLLPSALGRIFVRTYNKYSPPLAHFIAEHEVLKMAVRIGLLPLVAISYSTLHFGPIITLTILVVLLAISIFLVPFYRRKARLQSKQLTRGTYVHL